MCVLAGVVAASFLLGSAPTEAGFVEVTMPATFVAAPGLSYGSAWADFDLDGNVDCFVCRHYERPIIYRNLGDGHLNYIFVPPLFDPPLDHHGPLVADFDDDGDPDIYLTAGADAGFGDSEKKLYRNDGSFSFVNVSPSWGLSDLLARGRSSSAMDVEGDGDVDLFVAKSPRATAPNSLFLNDGSQHYVDVAASAGLADAFGSVAGIWGDYDRDGDPDLLIGGEESDTFQTRLYRNDGNATFRNVTSQTLGGVGTIAAAAWGDADNDGDLDLAVGLGDPGLFDAVAWNADSLRYFFNTRFEDNGLDGVAFMQTGDSATYNVTLNGFFIPSNVFISESAYHPAFSPFQVPFEIFGSPPFSPGQTTATYIWTQQFLNIWEMRCNAPPEAGHSFAGIITTNGDFTDAGIVAPEPYYHGQRGTRLWRNDGQWFVDVSASMGLVDTVNVHFLEWVDFDQDGKLDLYVENKGDTQTLNGPNLFYRNLGEAGFQNDTAEWNLAGPARGLGESFSVEDYDRDGDLDLLATSGTGPRFFTLFEQVRLYRNDTAVGHHLRVNLEGIWSTRDGYGAWVTCVSASAGRQVRYVTGNSWRGAQTMLDPYFGLGSDTVVDTLRVDWQSGSRNVLVGLAADTTVTVVENDPLIVAAPVTTSAPAELHLAATPNPATGAVVLVAQGRTVGAGARLTIWDAAGRRVLDKHLAPGESRAVWGGQDGRGRAATSGVYFARITEGPRVADTKIVHLAR